MSHSTILGGSIAERRIMCPGSAVAEAGKPDHTSEAARAGTLRHEVIAARFLGTEPPPHDDEARSDVDDALEAFDALVDEHFSELGDYLLVEQKVALPSVAEGVFGTVDLITAGKAKDGSPLGMVLDWKFGHRRVSARHNLQLSTYAVGVEDTLPHVLEGCERVLFAIVQPSHGYDVWETDRHWIGHVRGVLRDTVAKIAAGTDERNPGDWCRYCKGASECPKARGLLVQADEFPLASPVAYHEALALADKMEAFISNVRAAAMDAAMRGEQILGHKLVQKVARRKWRDEAAVLDALPEAAARGVLSPAQLEKALGKRSFAERAAHLVVQESSGLTLVADTDRRPAVEIRRSLAETLGLDPNDRIL